jgi:RHS repeat-associated protein
VLLNRKAVCRRLVVLCLLVGLLAPTWVARGTMVAAAGSEPAPLEYREVVMDDEPVRYWRVGETSGNAVEEMGSGYDLVPANPSQIVRGVDDALLDESDWAENDEDGAIELLRPGFSNGGNILVGSQADPPLPETDELTIELWIKAVPIVDAPYRTIYHHLRTGAAGTATVAIAIGGDNLTGSVQHEGSISVDGEGVLDDEWHHIVLRADGGGMRMFVDGESRAVRTDFEENQTFAPQKVTVGRTTGATANPFGGVVDEVAVYDYLLPHADIVEHYYASGREVPPGLGHLCCDVPLGDPVSSSSGNFLDTSTDLAFPSATAGLEVNRTYNSRDDGIGLFGPGWSSSLEIALRSSGGGYELRDESGRRSRFVSSGSGSERPDGISADVVTASGRTFVDWDDGRAWEFTDVGGSGRLVAMFDPIDADLALTSRTAATTFSYTSGQLTGVESVTTGRSLSIAYDGTHTDQVGSVTADDGRTVTYGYSTAGELETVSQSLSYPGGPSPVVETWKYHWTDGLISSIEDPDERVVIANEYVSSTPGEVGYGQVESQTTPHGGTVDYEYSFDFDTAGGPYAVTTLTDVASGDELVYVHEAATGRLLRTVDPFTNTVERSWQGNGQPATVEDRLGNEVTQTVDAHGNVTQRVQYDSAENVVATWDYVFDSQDRLKSETLTDPVSSVGYRTDYGHEAAERVPSTISIPYVAGTTAPDCGDPGACTHQDVDDDTGLVESITDPDGYQTAFAYNADRTLDFSTVDPGGLAIVTDYTYDALGNVWTVTVDPGGLDLTTTSIYDTRGRLRAQAEPGMAATTYGYDGAGNQTSVTDPLAMTTTYGYDPDSGELVSVTDPDDDETTYHYSTAGDLAYQIAPGDVVTDFDYGELARLESQVVDPYDATENPDGLDRAVGFGYDDDGNQTSRTVDPGGLDLVTTTDYDALGRVDSVDNGVDEPTTTVYDARGLVVSETDGNGIVTTYDYDAAGRQTATLIDGEEVETRGYTPGGRLEWVDVWESDTVQHRTTYDWDDAGRQDTVIDPESNATVTLFDAAGRPGTVTSAEGLVTDYTYSFGEVSDGVAMVDAAISTATHPATGTTSTAFNGRGQVVREATPDGATVWRYEDDGDLATVVDPQGGTVSYTWDGRGNRLTRTATGVGTDSWLYNAADEQTQGSDFDDRDTVTVYDDAGRVESITDPTNRVEDRTYDGAGRLDVVTWTHGADIQSVDYVYDDGGRLESRTDTGFGTGIDGTTTYGYDDFGHLDAITGPGLDLTFDLDRSGRRLASTQDGVVTTFTNDGNGRVATVANAWAGTTTYTYNGDGTLTDAALPDGQWRRWNVDETTGRIERFDQYVDGQRTVTDLDYHDDGQLASVTTGGLTTEYTYDDAGQLTHIDNGDVGTLDDEVFAYDALGRRSTHTQGGVVTTYGYDPNTGELATATTPGKDTVTYVYDDAGRLTTQSDSTSTIDYAYDPRGRLATIDHDTAAGEWTETHRHDGDGLLAELTVTDPNTGPDTTQRYTWDPTAGIAQIAAIDHGSSDWTHLAYGADGRIAAHLPGDTTVHFATDHQGSTTATPSTAGLAAAARYDAWGQPRSHTNPTHTTTFGYRGELTIGSDLTYLRNRYYQPETGTFTTRDPLDGINGTTTVSNPWHYTVNDPTNRRDPLGLRPTDGAFCPYSSGVDSSVDVQCRYGPTGILWVQHVDLETGCVARFENNLWQFYGCEHGGNDVYVGPTVYSPGCGPGAPGQYATQQGMCQLQPHNPHTYSPPRCPAWVSSTAQALGYGGYGRSAAYLLQGRDEEAAKEFLTTSGIVVGQEAAVRLTVWQTGAKWVSKFSLVTASAATVVDAACEFLSFAGDDR